MTATRRGRAAAALVAVLAAVAAALAAVGTDDPPVSPRLAGAMAFEQVVVAEDEQRPPNPHAKAVGDIDGDGLRDIVAAASTTGPIFWYRELADRSGWTTHTIRPSGAWSTEMRVGDVDGDGDLDVVLPHRDSLRWYENPRPDALPQDVTSWTERVIGVDGRDNHDVALGDVDGDGRLDVVSRPKAFRLSAPVVYVWLQTDTGWQRITITTDLRHKGEGSDLGDIDGDGDLDIALNGYWLENQAGATNWSALHVVDPIYFHPVHENDDPDFQSFVGVTIADVTGDGRADIVIGSSERFNGYLAVYEATDPRTGPDGRWRKTTIDTGVSYAHGIKTADMDGDGDLDVVTAESHQTTTLHGSTSRVLVYLNPLGSGSPDWQRHVVATTGSHNTQVGDFDADGDADIAGVNWGTDGAGGPAAPDGARVYLWRNLLVDDPAATTTTSSTSSTSSSSSTSTSSTSSTSSSSTSSTTTAAPAVNLAPNPGFESSPTTHWFTHGTGTFTWATDSAWTGARSLKVISSQGSTSLARWLSRTTIIPAEPGRTYRARVFMRTSAVSNKAVLAVNFWDASSRHLGTVESVKLSATNTWRLLTLDAAAPAGTRYVRVEFRLYGPGTIWADDVELVRL